MQWTVFKCFYLFVGCLQILLVNLVFTIIILFGFRCGLLLYFLIVVVIFILFCRVVVNCNTKLSSYCKHVFFRFTKSRKINKIVKLSKRKAQTVSYDDAVADILNWVENPDNDENFELETNRFSDDSDDSDEERDNIQSEQEEKIEEPHVPRHTKIPTSSRLVHSIDSTLDLDNYDEMAYLNKDRCWETFVGYLGPKSNKQRKRFFDQVTFLHVLGGKDNVTIFQVVNQFCSILLGRAKHIETNEDAFDLFLMKKCFL